MKKFRTLDLAVEFYSLVQEIDIKGNLRDQLHRAASSISLNLAEGNAKGSAKEKKQFFQTAYGSLRECQVIFRLLKLNDQEISQKADRLGGCLYKLLSSEIKPFPARISDI
jgi:four helix bundle protein